MRFDDLSLKVVLGRKKEDKEHTKKRKKRGGKNLRALISFWKYYCIYIEWPGRDLKNHVVSTRLLWARMPSSRPGCLELHA